MRNLVRFPRVLVAAVAAVAVRGCVWVVVVDVRGCVWVAVVVVCYVWWVVGVVEWLIIF